MSDGQRKMIGVLKKFCFPVNKLIFDGVKKKLSNALRKKIGKYPRLYLSSQGLF